MTGEARVTGSFRAEDAALRAANADLERLASEHAFHLQRARHRLAVLERRFFGRSSEKASPSPRSFLGGLAAPAAEDVPGDEAKGEATPDKRKKRARGREPLPADLPRERAREDHRGTRDGVVARVWVQLRPRAPGLRTSLRPLRPAEPERRGGRRASHRPRKGWRSDMNLRAHRMAIDIGSGYLQGLDPAVAGATLAANGRRSR